MRKILTIFFLLLSTIAFSQGIVERHILSTDITETENSFIYRHIYVPVLDITYHEFSADSITWSKDYHAGDCYIRFNNYIDNSTSDAPDYHPDASWWVFNFCTCNGKIDTTQGSGRIDTLVIDYGSQIDTLYDVQSIKIPMPDTLTGTTTNYQDSLIHTHVVFLYLNDIKDVDAHPTDGQVLKWSAGVQKWIAGDDLYGTGAGDSTVIIARDGLTPTYLNDTLFIDLGTPDTITGTSMNVVSAASHSHLLQININDALDVNAFPTDGQVLTWDSITNQWIAGNGGSGSPLTVMEEDGYPYVTSVNKIRVADDHLVDRGNGEISILFPDSVGGGSNVYGINDFYRTGRVWMPPGDNRITFSTPLPDSTYVVAGLYATYPNGARQNLNYSLKDTAGFTALGTMDSTWIHYLAIMPNDSLGLTIDFSTVNLSDFLDVVTDSASEGQLLRFTTIDSTWRNVSPHTIDVTEFNTDTLDLQFVTDNDSVTTNGIYTNGITTSYVQIDTTTTSSKDIGRFSWNNTEETVDLGLPDGVILQLGQETLVRVRNKTGTTIPDGTPVSLVSASGSHVDVVKTDISSDTLSMTFIGVTTQDIVKNDYGLVTVLGVVHQINTSGLTEGLPVFVSAMGTLTNTRPEPPLNSVGVGVCQVKGVGNGEIFVSRAIFQKLTFLSDVYGSPTDGQFPVWNSDSLYFEFDKSIYDFAQDSASVTDVFAVRDSLFPIEYLRYTKDSVDYDVTTLIKPNGLISGGNVSWRTGFKFDISPAAYYIEGQLYTSPTDSVTLDSADVTLPRLDIIVVDTTGTVDFVTGVPAANPQKPTIDPSYQIELTVVLVPAGVTDMDTVITSDEMVYDENVEWTGTTVGVTSDFNNGTGVFSGVKDIKISNVGSNDSIKFAHTGDLTSSDYTTLISYFKLRATMYSGQNINVTFTYNGHAVSMPYVLPINKALTNTWQNISLPLTAVNFSSNTFNGIAYRWSKTGLSPSTHIGFYMDYIKLQGGIIQPVTNSDIELDGDVTGTGVTGTPIITTLDSVNANVGSFGSKLKSVHLTVDKKGRITAVSDSTMNFATPEQVHDSLTTYGWIHYGNSVDLSPTDHNVGIGTPADTLYKVSILSNTSKNGLYVETDATYAINATSSNLFNAYGGYFAAKKGRQGIGSTSSGSYMGVQGMVGSDSIGYAGYFVNDCDSGYTGYFANNIATCNGVKILAGDTSLQDALSVYNYLGTVPFFSIRGDGSMRLDQYGSGTFSGITTKFLAVDASGNVVEQDPTSPTLWVAAPATKTSPGMAGQMAYDINYFYVCVQDSVWKRTPLSSW